MPFKNTSSSETNYTYSVSWEENAEEKFEVFSSQDDARAFFSDIIINEPFANYINLVEYIETVKDESEVLDYYEREE